MLRYLIFIFLILTGFAVTQDKTKVKAPNPNLNKFSELKAEIEILKTEIKNSQIEVENIKSENDKYIKTIKDLSAISIKSADQNVNMMYNIYLIIAGFLGATIIILGIFGFRQIRNINDQYIDKFKDHEKDFENYKAVVNDQIKNAKSILDELDIQKQYFVNFQKDEYAKGQILVIRDLIKSKMHQFALKKVDEALKMHTTNRTIRAYLYALKAYI